MVKNTFLFVLALFLSACNSDDKPDGLIARDKMVDIITELQLLEAKVSRLSLSSYDSSMVAFNFLQKEILDKHKVDSLQYAESFGYYSTKPRYFSEMFDEAEQKLKKMEDELSTEKIDRK